MDGQVGNVHNVNLVDSWRLAFFQSPNFIAVVKSALGRGDGGMRDNDTRQRQLAITISRSASDSEADHLRLWVQGLLRIRESDLSSYAKAKQAVGLTASSKVALPVLKIVAKQSKVNGWDNRSAAQRMGMGAAAASVVLFGGANAGIAALGTAIGVPLWIVIGGRGDVR